MLDFPGVSGGCTLGKNNAEQERPYLAAQAVTTSGKDLAYKAGQAEVARSQEGVRGYAGNGQ